MPCLRRQNDKGRTAFYDGPGKLVRIVADGFGCTEDKILGRPATWRMRIATQDYGSARRLLWMIPFERVGETQIMARVFQPQTLSCTRCGPRFPVVEDPKESDPDRTINGTRGTSDESPSGRCRIRFGPIR